MFSHFKLHTSNFTGLLVAFALMFATAACDGPVGPQGDRGLQGEQGDQGSSGQDGADGQNGQDGADGEQGEQGEQGSPGPAGEDGEDGNANATVFIFDGHDFSSSDSVSMCTPAGDVGFLDTAWLYYLVRFPAPFDARVYPVPGYGQDNLSEYYIFNDFGFGVCADEVLHRILLASGDGENYPQIRIIRIESTNVEDCTGGGCLRAATEPELPADLDVSDYQAVIDYYGLSEEDAIRL